MFWSGLEFVRFGIVMGVLGVVIALVATMVSPAPAHLRLDAQTSTTAKTAVTASTSKTKAGKANTASAGKTSAGKTSTAAAPSNASAASATAAGQAAGATARIMLLPGDTLSALAERFNTTVAELQSLNGLGSSTLIIAGQSLVVPVLVATPSTTTSSSPSPVQHKTNEHAKKKTSHSHQTPDAHNSAKQ